LNPSADDMERLYDDQAFLAHQLWVDPCTDAIWTEPDLGDGHFNPTDRGYRCVCLSRKHFLEAIRSLTNTQADYKPAGKQRVRTIGRVRNRVFGRAAVLRPGPEWSVARGPGAEGPTESLDAPDWAEAPTRNHARQWHKATPQAGPPPPIRLAAVPRPSRPADPGQARRGPG
jgi:hypothetical protein